MFYLVVAIRHYLYPVVMIIFSDIFDDDASRLARMALQPATLSRI